MSKADFLETITLWEAIMHEAFGYSLHDMEVAEVDALTLAGKDATSAEYFSALRRLVMSDMVGGPSL
uniref:Uncharacterized protein n=1 Tax=viral metagenome TaxID=1070528 RepID=A0A6H1ZPV0_9ZZZZ